MNIDICEQLLRNTHRYGRRVFLDAMDSDDPQQVEKAIATIRELEIGMKNVERAIEREVTARRTEGQVQGGEGEVGAYQQKSNRRIVPD